MLDKKRIIVELSNDGTILNTDLSSIKQFENNYEVLIATNALSDVDGSIQLSFLKADGSAYPIQYAVIDEETYNDKKTYIWYGEEQLTNVCPSSTGTLVLTINAVTETQDVFTTAPISISLIKNTRIYGNVASNADSVTGLATNLDKIGTVAYKNKEDIASIISGEIVAGTSEHSKTSDVAEYAKEPYRELNEETGELHTLARQSDEQTSIMSGETKVPHSILSDTSTTSDHSIISDLSEATKTAAIGSELSAWMTVVDDTLLSKVDKDLFTLPTIDSIGLNDVLIIGTANGNYKYTGEQLHSYIENPNSSFLGIFDSYESFIFTFPTGTQGQYAYVNETNESGTNSINMYIWDQLDNEWHREGSGIYCTVQQFTLLEERIIAREEWEGFNFVQFDIEGLDTSSYTGVVANKLMKSDGDLVNVDEVIELFETSGDKIDELREEITGNITELSEDVDVRLTDLSDDISNNYAKNSDLDTKLDGKITSDNTVMIGSNVTEATVQSITIGDGLGDCVIGTSTSSSYPQSRGIINVGFGNDTSTTSDSTYGNTFGTIIGHDNSITGYSSISIGSKNKASNDASISVGYSNNASGSQASAIGYSNTASGTFSSAVGYGNFASGNYSSAFGRGNTTSGIHSSAFGRGNSTSGAYTCVIGYLTTEYTAGAVTSPRIKLGSADTNVYLGSGTAVSSDIKDKTDFKDIDSALLFLSKIEGYRYLLNNRETYYKREASTFDEDGNEQVGQLIIDENGKPVIDTASWKAATKKGSRYHLGVKAQEVYKALIETYGDDQYHDLVYIDNYDDVKDRLDEDADDIRYHVNYTGFTPYLIEAVNELNKENQELKDRLKTIEDKLGL